MKSAIILAAMIAATASASAFSHIPQRRANIPAYANAIPGGKAGWYPTKVVTQNYDHASDQWVNSATTTVTYDDKMRITSTKTALPPETGSDAYTTTMTYKGDATLPDTVTAGAFNNALQQTYIEYDPMVTDYPVLMKQRTKQTDGSWGPWAVTLDIDVARDAQGRVTSVTPKILADHEVEDIERIEITYGADGFPSTIVSHVAEDDDNGGVEFDEAETITNMKFEKCDNQILRLTDLYRAPNKLLACDVTDEDSERSMTFEYGSRGSFTSKSKGTEYGEAFEAEYSVEYLDDNGSYYQKETTLHTATGYKDEETDLWRFDEYGLMIEHRETDSSTDPEDLPHEIDSSMRGQVTYTAADGKPAYYTVSSQIEGSHKFAPVVRMLFDGFDPAGIEAPDADAKPARKGIFTLDGRALPEGIVPAPGFYIIDGVKTLVR